MNTQLRVFDLPEYAGFPVKLRAKESCIYGVVFASYVRRKHEPDTTNDFVKRVRKAGRDVGFRYHDGPFPLLTPVYEHVPVKLLQANYLVSLYIGLWRPEAAEKGHSKGERLSVKRVMTASA